MRELFLIIIGAGLILSCKKDREVIAPKMDVEIPFTGTWQRKFEAGPGNLHTVSYFIYQDSMRYELTGPIGQANYLLIRDEFTLKDNRFIGHNDTNQLFLIFVKDVTNDSLSLYKQKINSLNEGKNMNVPSDTTTQNHGWNRYGKQ